MATPSKALLPGENWLLAVIPSLDPSAEQLTAARGDQAGLRLLMETEEYLSSLWMGFTARQRYASTRTTTTKTRKQGTR